MSGKVCSDFLDPTDLDDLMLQNLATLGLSIEQPLPGNSSNPKTISPISEILNKEQSLGDVADVPEQAEQAEQADLQLCDEAYWANNWHAAYTNCSVAASVGNNIAQSYLGWLYYNGLGVIINKERAAQLYTLAAKQGNVNAQLNLGAMYLTGDGVEKNLEDAFQLTMDAANQSSPTGQHNLASMYFNGNGVSRNYAEAVRWWKLAIQNGYSGATRLSEAENFAQAESPEMRDGYRSCLRKIEIDYSRQVKNSYDEVVRAYGLQSTTYEGFDGTGDRARQLNFGNNALFTVYIVAIEERYSGRNIDTINTLSGFTYCVLDKKSGALLGVEYKLEY